jgi:zinc protease
LVAFHRDFYGAQPAQLAVVGDFDADGVQRQVAQLLGDWKAPKAFTRVPTEFKEVPAREFVIETPDKAQAVFVAGVNLSLRDDDPDYPALVLGNYMLGGGFLNSRLVVRLRQKDGLSYGAGSQLQGDSFDKSGTFMAYAIYAPENVVKLQLAFNEEMNRVINEGFTAEEIAQAKSGWSQLRSVARANDNELVGGMSHYLFLGRTLAWDQQFEARVMALEAEQILAAFKRHLQPEKFTVIKSGDFANKPAQ